MPAPAADASASIPVSELARRARLMLEREFPVAWVSGELSGVTRAASGHLYFSLKDEAAQVRCVMFRTRAQLLPFEARAGLRVEVRAQVSLYEARGDFQLNVEAMRTAGVGSLYEAFLRLKSRLAEEGLFETERKRPLPRLPSSVAIVTSPAAAALRDVLITLSRRAPQIRLTLLPCPVQGPDAPPRIAAALHRIVDTGCELVLLVRGGGSVEDLAAFNDEAVARAIAACAVPVVTGIGHETDFSIADFVADLRAPTPTAAAEMISAGHVELRAKLAALHEHLQRRMRERLDRQGRRLDDAASRLIAPSRRLELARERLDGLQQRLFRATAVAARRRRDGITALGLRLGATRPDLPLRRATLARLERALARGAEQALSHAAQRLQLAASSLHALDPDAVLMRGFAIVRDEAGHIVGRADELRCGQPVLLQFAEGRARADITGFPGDTVAGDGG
nr:exodeoxyribonuclease VII large subunit [Methyloversatilis thermotolerans]